MSNEAEKKPMSNEEDKKVEDKKVEDEKIEAVHCNFCNRSDAEVRHMIAGPDGVFICDFCVDTCRDIIGVRRHEIHLQVQQEAMQKEHQEIVAKAKEMDKAEKKSGQEDKNDERDAMEESAGMNS